MDPSDKTPFENKDTIAEALTETNADLAVYVADYFASADMKQVTKLVINNTGEDTWAQYEAVSSDVIEALAAGDEEVMERVKLSAFVHKAIVYKTMDDAIRYFGELQTAADYAAQSEFIYVDEIDETIREVVDTFLDQTGVSFEDVAAQLLLGTATDDSERLRLGQKSAWADGADPRDALPEAIVDSQLALEEEVSNGADLQDILGELYRFIINRGEDPKPIFAQLGFPETIPV
jgi:hypothetical protein